MTVCGVYSCVRSSTLTGPLVRRNCHFLTLHSCTVYKCSHLLTTSPSSHHSCCTISNPDQPQQVIIVTTANHRLTLCLDGLMVTFEWVQHYSSRLGLQVISRQGSTISPALGIPRINSQTYSGSHVVFFYSFETADWHVCWADNAQVSFSWSPAWSTLQSLIRSESSMISSRSSNTLSGGLRYQLLPAISQSQRTANNQISPNPIQSLL